MVRARIIVSGFAGLLPGGGVAWDYLQYVLGFLQLGHDVYYVEDTRCWPTFTREESAERAGEESIRRLASASESLGIGDRWAYRNIVDESWHGLSDSARAEVISSADILVNISGSARVSEYLHVPDRIFIDSDPMFTQIQLASETNLLGEQGGLSEEVGEHTSHFTFGLNVGSPDCEVPLCGYEWIPTVQPVSFDHWRCSSERPRRTATTIANFSATEPIDFAGKRWGQKDEEFPLVRDIPAQRPGIGYVIAAGGRSETISQLKQRGWKFVDANDVVSTPDEYQRFVSESLLELSVAKNAYVGSRSGWFSGRSACYLAAGRPVITQDTGWSDHLPAGHGLLPFDSTDSAVAALDNVLGDLASHERGARSLAHEHFEARAVLTSLLDRGCRT